MSPEQVFPARLRAARTALGLTQAALAVRAQVSRQRVSKGELGQEMPHATTVVKLAMALQVSTDWLLGLSESTVPTDDGGAWEVAVQLSPSNRAWWVGLGKTLITEQHLMEENVRRWRQQV